MDHLTNIVNILTSTYCCWQEKREQDEVMEYLNKYLYLPHCEKFIINSVRDLKNGNTEELKKIGQEFVKHGELELANKVNTLVNGEVSISEELYTAVESYLNSSLFHKEVETYLASSIH
jgi:hypothetical protein